MSWADYPGQCLQRLTKAARRTISLLSEEFARTHTKSVTILFPLSCSLSLTPTHIYAHTYITHTHSLTIFLPQVWVSNQQGIHYFTRGLSPIPGFKKYRLRFSMQVP